MWASSDGSVVGCERVLDGSVGGCERVLDVSVVGCEWVLDVSVSGCERVLDVSVSWMSVGWWSGGETMVNGGSMVKRIKIKKEKRKTAI